MSNQMYEYKDFIDSRDIFPSNAKPVCMYKTKFKFKHGKYLKLPAAGHKMSFGIHNKN